MFEYLAIVRMLSEDVDPKQYDLLVDALSDGVFTKEQLVDHCQVALGIAADNGYTIEIQPSNFTCSEQEMWDYLSWYDNATDPESLQILEAAISLCVPADRIDSDYQGHYSSHEDLIDATYSVHDDYYFRNES